MTHVITKLCQRLGDCVEVCPVDAIVPGPKDSPEWGNGFYIDPDRCIDCGACANACGCTAIFPLEEVPTEHKDSIARNKKFFTEGPGHWNFDLQNERKK